jgi:hypothetical protein
MEQYIRSVAVGAVGPPPSYSWGPGFRSWLKIVVVFRNTSKQMLRTNLRLVNDRFIPHPFQFMIYSLFYYSRLYILSYWHIR